MVGDPVKFIDLNSAFFNGTEYHPPDGCSVQGTEEICARTGAQVTRYSYLEWIFTSKPNVMGLIPGWANLTGVGLILILTIMCICSMPIIRKKGHFEVGKRLDFVISCKFLSTSIW